MLVAHDLETGLAMRPHWGPLNGPQAVSEQQLLEEAIDRLPPAALVVGDANFGVFSVAYAASQRGHAVLLRLTAQRAQRLAGGRLRDGIDRRITWRPTRHDRKTHPRLPPDACVRGRLLVCQVQPSYQAAPFLLALFTTWDADQQPILDVYGRRWYIETDLRSLKSTLQLEQLTCDTAAMVAKANRFGHGSLTNLVRAVMYLTARKAGWSRALSASPMCATCSTPSFPGSPLPLTSAKRKIDRRHAILLGLMSAPKRKRKRPAQPQGRMAQTEVLLAATHLKTYAADGSEPTSLMATAYRTDRPFLNWNSEAGRSKATPGFRQKSMGHCSRRNPVDLGQSVHSQSHRLRQDPPSGSTRRLIQVMACLNR